jgi:hypothetical protein
VDDSWNKAKKRQANVDEQVTSTTTFKKNTEWWENNSADDFANVGCGEGHDGLFEEKVLSGSKSQLDKSFGWGLNAKPCPLSIQDDNDGVNHPYFVTMNSENVPGMNPSRVSTILRRS